MKTSKKCFSHSMQVFVLTVAMSGVLSISNAQDPAFSHFHQQPALFNPAYAGGTGSQAVSLVYRNQWFDKDVSAYQTAALQYEESVPCSILDYGLGFLWDLEGDGPLITYEFSGRLSANLPLAFNKDHHVNLRLGGEMAYGGQRIDYSRLVFSDQLDDKYGNIYPTSFNPGDEDFKARFLQPGFGLTLQMILHKDKPSAVLLNFGAAYHATYGLGNNESVGYGKSILGLLPRQTPRTTVHADFEIAPGASLRRFVSLKPVVVFEHQGGLHYWQYGLDIGLLESMRVGGYMHSQGFGQDGKNTHWLTLAALFRPYLGNSRVDLHLAFSLNTSGLRSLVGPTIEIGIKKHFRSSPVCNLLGKSDDVEYSKGTKCRYSRISPAKKKIYENIWYKSGV